MFKKPTNLSVTVRIAMFAAFLLILFGQNMVYTTLGAFNYSRLSSFDSSNHKPLVDAGLSRFKFDYPQVWSLSLKEELGRSHTYSRFLALNIASPELFFIETEIDFYWGELSQENRNAQGMRHWYDKNIRQDAVVPLCLEQMTNTKIGQALACQVREPFASVVMFRQAHVITVLHMRSRNDEFSMDSVQHIQ